MREDIGVQVLLVTRCGCEQHIVIPKFVETLGMPMRTARHTATEEFRTVLETRIFDWHHSDDRGAFFYERGCF